MDDYEYLMNVVKAIRKVIDDELNIYPKPFSGELGITELVGCPRFVFYARSLGRKLGDEALFGVAIHELVLWKLARELGCKHEVRGELVVEGVRVFGKADLVCDENVIELKTGKYALLRDSWVYQCLAYMHMFDKSVCYVIELDRNTLDVIATYTVVRDDEKLMSFLLPRVRELRDALTLGVLPTTRVKELCGKCEYKSLCRGDKSLVVFGLNRSRRE